MIEWKPVCRGAFGVEVSLCGFGVGRDLFHRYARLGVLTVYITTQPLYRFLKLARDARDELRGRGPR